MYPRLTPYNRQSSLPFSHIDADNSFYQSLFLSKMDISNTPLFDLHNKGQVKAITLSRVSQLLALCEYIKSSFTKEKVLILLEGLSLVLLSQKVCKSLLYLSHIIQMTHINEHNTCSMQTRM
ncbi:hypothetical protein EON65_30125 [archaeon]|nr:MAG: hypothetical protein EON65_30125 [archaeon]